MRAFYTGVFYLGTFVAIGWMAKRLLDRWIARHGATLEEVNEQAGANAGKGRRFLLGFWRNED